MIEMLRRASRPVFQRAPRLRSLTLAVLEAAARPVLLPFRLSRPPSIGPVTGLEAQTDDLNRAAERYYAENANRQHLLSKPFSEPEAAARRLIDVGILIDSLRLQPGDVVMELGAGTCWVSHLLNLYGYATVAVDVSATALSMGRTRFEQDPRTNWTLEPQFLPYDGHRLPVGDASVDHVLLYDAYHHLPNPARLMREMRRVLRPSGIVAMSEPGRGHAASASSVAEVAETGVLENELVLEEIAELAIASGFSAARVVVAPNLPIAEVDALQVRSFMGGKGFARYWRDLCASLDGHHYVLLFAGDPVPTTRRPKRLKSIIHLSDNLEAIWMRRDEPTGITVDLYNAGDTRWLHAENTPGWTRLAAHLYRIEGKRTLVDFDWLRAPLPHDVNPEQQARVDITLPAIETPGSYAVVIDLVIEGTAWFADRGSIPLSVACVVE